MIQSHLTPSSERIIEPMIGLARCSKRHRIIVAGSRRSELMFELHRRGYSRVATTTTCGLPDGQYDVALVDWRQHSINALETTLDWLVHFLGAVRCAGRLGRSPGARGQPKTSRHAGRTRLCRRGRHRPRPRLRRRSAAMRAPARSPKSREAQPCPRPDVTFCGSPAMRLRCRRHSTMQANSICLRLNVSVIVRSRAGQPRWWYVERPVKLPP